MLFVVSGLAWALNSPVILAQLKATSLKDTIEQLPVVVFDVVHRYAALWPALTVVSGVLTLLMAFFLVWSLQGYAWHFFANYKLQGANTPPPTWRDSFAIHMADGFKFSIVSLVATIILILPVFLIFMALGTAFSGYSSTEFLGGNLLFRGCFQLLANGLYYALTVALLGAMPEQRTWGTLLGGWGQKWTALTQRGASLLRSILLFIGLYLVYSLLFVITGVTVVGTLAWPFLFAAWFLSAQHLMAQAYYGLESDLHPLTEKTNYQQRVVPKLYRPQ